MAAADQVTIEGFAKRSDRTIMKITTAFAIGGALLEIGANFIANLFKVDGGISALWGMWIPLCFVTIPPIHYLCRRILSLQARLESLESQRAKRRVD